MECYYHPGRESTDNCAICGKSICKECGLEIAGKTYCKECLEKIVGLGIENTSPTQNQTVVPEQAPRVEPPTLEKRPITETIYQTQDENKYYSPQNDKTIPDEDNYYSPQNDKRTQDIINESPYNIRDNINYSPGYKQEIRQEPQIAQNEYDIYPEHDTAPSQDYIYPEHDLTSQPQSELNLEDKYERYLDDLYYDENEIPLEEQLAKDEEQYGSLTRRPYQPRSEEAIEREKLAQRPLNETPEQMEARIRAEILAEKEGKSGIRDSNIHNLKYKDEKEPMNIVDILLTIVLIIVILIVIYYVIYIFILQNAYPTFMDAIFGLTNPQNVINNILTPPQ